MAIDFLYVPKWKVNHMYKMTCAFLTFSYQKNTHTEHV